MPPCSNRQTGQRVSVREIRYRKQPPTVRNMRAVLKKASWGTRRIIGSIRCKKQAFPVREGYSVPETAFWCTERIFKGAQNSLLWYAKRFLRHSATKKGSWGTRCVFKGPQNSTCHIERIFKGPQNSRLHRLWTASCRTGRIFRGVPCQKQHLPLRQVLQCAKRPPLSLFAPAAPSLAPSTALGTRNAHRSEVSKYKKRMTSKSIKTF